jgi:hypothetical protein
VNRKLIIDVWDGRVDAVAEDVYPLLRTADSRPKLTIQLVTFDP